MYCKQCGRQIADRSVFCSECGSHQGANDMNYNQTQIIPEAKNRIVAGLLALFLGTLGIHNFYLGYTSKGITQLLLTTIGWIILIGPLIAAVWAFIEAIQIFMGSISVDANGVRLRD